MLRNGPCHPDGHCPDCPDTLSSSSIIYLFEERVPVNKTAAICIPGTATGWLTIRLYKDVWEKLAFWIEFWILMSVLYNYQSGNVLIICISKSAKKLVTRYKDLNILFHPVLNLLHMYLIPQSRVYIDYTTVSNVCPCE